jgi:hypothetical protein
VRFRLGLALLLLVLAGACVDDNGGALVGGTLPSVAVTTSTTTSATNTTVPAAEPSDLAQGRTPVYVTAADVDHRTITVDVIQFLTGDAATAAYQQETGETDTPPNDYYIVNANPKLRTLTVADGVKVTLLRMGDPTGDVNGTPGTFEELPEYLESHRYGNGEPFKLLGWITFDGDMVTAIDEQYVP